MKFATFSLLALAAASITSAAPVTRDDGDTHFIVLASNPGGDFDLNSIKKIDSHLQVFGVGGSEGNDVSLTLKTDGTLVDQDGVGIFVDPNTGEFGDVDPWGQKQPSTGFEIKDSFLIYQGNSDWKACPSGADIYSLANNDCTGGTGIALKVVDPVVDAHTD